jgi:hypothetical protein
MNIIYQKSLLFVYSIHGNIDMKGIYIYIYVRIPSSLFRTPN